MNPVDIIFLDAGRTLLYPKPKVEEVYARLGRRHGADVPAAEIARSFPEAFRQVSEELPNVQDRAWWTEVVRRTFAAAGAAPDLDPLVQDLSDYFATPDGWHLYPGTVEALATLRSKGYRLGLISNWDDRLPELLTGLGLIPGLDPVVVSAIEGVSKPDPGIFAIALERADVPAERALMVGDDPVADIEGALAVGMRAIRVDHGAEHPKDGVMRSLAELPDRL
jgi:putative hydrolase of the HAD superfamily